MAKYRPDIDGLRAIAVGAVVLFHAGFTALSGGFVGVDVFFVISGYLITANLHGDLLRGRFSILGFYERRARRILPALFVMIAASGVGALMFLPNDLKLFGESAVFTVLSLSNLFFFRHTGYFDVGATVSPLLHTWSLAVEEQFYLGFPLVLWAGARMAKGRRTRLVALIAVLWAASFAFSLWQVAHDQRAAFYLPFARAWELLTGALLATGPAPPPGRRWMREAGGAGGLLLVLGAVLFMPAAASFPGLNALPPCLGAALVIWAGGAEGGRASWAARLLQLRPVVFVGLISYSLYLWHWPLLVFARYYGLGELGLAARIVVVACAIGAATASWWFVERPFRTRRLLTRRPALFGACAVAGLAVCVCGGAVALAQGFPGRLAPAAAQLASGADDHNPYRDHCFALTAQDLDAGRFCRIGAPAGRPTLMVWGDSHADAVMSAFDAAARAHGIAGVEATHGSCPPLLGVEVHEREDNLCPPLADAALALIERYDIRKVVLAGRWAGYAEGRLYQAGAPPVVLRQVGAPVRAIRGDNHALFAAALERTLARLRGEGRRVYVLLPAPEVGRPVPDTLARAVVFHRAVDLAPTRRAYDARQRFVRATLDRLAARFGVVEIDPAALLCGPARCRLTLDGRTLYYDTDHLSVHGAQFISPLLAPVFADASGSAARLATVGARPLGGLRAGQGSSATPAPRDQRGASLIAPSSRIAAAFR